MGSSLIEGTSFSVRGARGSVGAALLFGPLAVAANTAYVAGTNASRGNQLGSITQTDVNALLREMLPTGSATASDVYELVPMVSAYFTDDTHFRFECFIFANILSGDQRSWRNSFFRFVAAEQHDTASPGFAVTNEEIQTCVRGAYRAFTAFVDHGGEFTEQSNVRIEDESSRTLHYLRTEDGRLIFNYYILVTSYPAELVVMNAPN